MTEEYDLFLKAATSKKALKIIALDVTDLTSIADCFIIMSGRSSRQVTAIAEHIKTELKKDKVVPLSIEGAKDGQWVLLDYGYVIIHVFYEPVREFFDLEGLWADAKRIKSKYLEPDNAVNNQLMEKEQIVEKKKPVCLVIMDGWGIAPADERNALEAADTPNLDKYKEQYPNASLNAHGLDVGLPDGNQGNSEVGHLNIGAGRVVNQMLVRIDTAVTSGTIFENEILKGAVEHCKENNSTLHLMGLIQDQGVHAVTRHCNALLAMCGKMDFENVFVHVFSDGRDTPPKSCATYMEELEKGFAEAGVGRVGSVIGRYYAMDRDNRWERVQIAYDGLTKAEGEECATWQEAIEKSYAADENDEFIKPKILPGFTGIKEGDAIINFNFRLDRARELTHAITDTEFSGFEREKIKNLKYIAMTNYYDDGEFEVAFPPKFQTAILGEILSKNGLKQVRCAETEKYAHVTFFFNDSGETPFENEDRILVDSPKVATYDLQPEMSAFEVKDKVLGVIAEDTYDVIIVNFANADMVGHTGVFDAVITAAQTVDECVGAVTDAATAKGGAVIITADHGNGECMMLEDGSPMTAHTTNPVPVFIAGMGDVDIRTDGRLADLAPTMLKILGIDQPAEMKGEPLF